MAASHPLVVSWLEDCMIEVTCMSCYLIILFFVTIFGSYHLMIGGTLLSSLSLFALSFVQPNCFYQVNIVHASFMIFAND